MASSDPDVAPVTRRIATVSSLDHEAADPAVGIAAEVDVDGRAAAPPDLTQGLFVDLARLMLAD